MGTHEETNAIERKSCRSPYLYDVFLSHNADQKAWVRAVVSQWRQLGLTVFFDEDSIEPGGNVAAILDKALRYSRHIVLVVTPESMRSRWVALEQSAAIHLDPSADRQALIPVLLTPTPDEDIPLLIRTRNRIDLTDPSTRQREYARLVTSLISPPNLTSPTVPLCPTVLAQGNGSVVRSRPERRSASSDGRPSALVPIRATSPSIIQWLMYHSPLRSRFVRTYTNRLLEELRFVETLGRSQPIALDGVYVSQRLRTHRRPHFVSDTAGIEALKSPVGDIPDQAVETVLGLSTRLGVLGSPGLGKTTLLRSLAIRVARGDERLTDAVRRHGSTPGKRGCVFPILVTLNDVARTTNSLLDGMVASVANHGCYPALVAVMHNLRKGRCLCLFDGLDEVVDETQRDQIKAQITSLARSYPGNAIVVSSRLGSFEYGLGPDFSLMELVEFADVQIREFVAKWFSSEPDRAAGLVVALNGTHRIKSLAANPLLLTVICLVYELDTRLPERRVELYDRCVWVLTHEWERLKKLSFDDRRTDPDALRRHLRRLALWLHQKHQRLVSRTSLIAFFRQECGSDAAATGLLDEVVSRTGVLVQVSADSYAFAHLTLQEYLAAVEVAESSQRSLVIDKVNDGWWEEVLVLLAGIDRDASALVRELIDKTSDSTRALVISARCLIDADLTETTLRNEVVTRLLAWLERTTDTRLIAGVVDLADALDEASWAHLTALLHHPSQDVRIRVIEVLGAIGAERGIPPLVETAVADDAMAVRRVAALSLRAMRGGDPLRALLDDLLCADISRASRAAEALGWLGDELSCTALTSLGADLSRPRELRLAAGRALGCVTASVPAGDFIMGSHLESDERPARNVHVEAFVIDRYPVTNAQYEQFVSETGTAPPPSWKGSSCPIGLEIHPVTSISWHDAMRYAAWSERRLPTEQEWEKAARGRDGRMYPWGSTFDAQRCNTFETNVGTTTPVGKYAGGASPYGAFDMCGNVWEWTSDDYLSESTVSSGAGTNQKVVRGAGYNAVRDIARCSYRHVHEANKSSDNVGFRCAS